jgi:hypothetical protein
MQDAAGQRRSRTTSPDRHGHRRLAMVEPARRRQRRSRMVAADGRDSRKRARPSLNYVVPKSRRSRAVPGGVDVQRRSCLAGSIEKGHPARTPRSRAAQISIPMSEYPTCGVGHNFFSTDVWGAREPPSDSGTFDLYDGHPDCRSTPSSRSSRRRPGCASPYAAWRARWGVRA